jgi:DNA-binding transcriptional MocR family regulator
MTAERHGIALAYLGSHWHQRADREQGIVVGYSRPTTAAFDEVLQDLVSVLRAAIGGAAADSTR